LRAKEKPTASTPVSWEEVAQTMKKKNAQKLVFRCDQTLARVAKLGDLFDEVEKLRQKLPKKWTL
jgi:bifunctional non-homologous end joining protein LigD